MSTSEKALGERIRELRRRHFGARGKAEFARRLGLAVEEYERFERGRLPTGELMVRMCELTGEDLQWLLTGVPARGTVVISGARSRHQNLLAQIAEALDTRPELAAPLDAFLDLLLSGASARRQGQAVLPAPAPEELIPLFGPGEWPEELPDPDDDPGGSRLLAPVALEAPLTAAARASAHLAEPAMEYDRGALRDVVLLSVPAAAAPARRFVYSREVARCFPMAFGVQLDDDLMQPMFTAGDVLLVGVGMEPQIGKPALCKFSERADDRCRVWLGQDEQYVHLGRVSDGEHEQMPRSQLRWSLEVLYRVAEAA